jgi:hypothetical protein
MPIHISANLSSIIYHLSAIPNIFALFELLTDFAAIALPLTISIAAVFAIWSFD